jgi:hypothetical protein
MALNDVIITKTTGGLGRRNPSGDMISGLLANGVSVTGGVQLGTVYRLKSIQDALALLIDAAYDTANGVLVFEHIKEFFRVNPNGDLYIMLVAKTVSYADMVDKAIAANAKKLLIEAEGQIRQLAVAYNPAVAVTDFTATNAAITKAQELAAEEYVLHRPVDIVLEGKGFNPASPENFRVKNAENVAVMVGQAMSVASGNATYAAVGTLLGSVSKAKVNECVAWVEKFNVLGGSLEAPGIGGSPVTSFTQGQLTTLNDNGSIYFRTHTGKAGIYFNDSHTATSLTSDYAYIENNRTIHKAVRLVREILLPRLASPVLIDQETGQLSPEVVKSFEGDGRRALEAMLKNEEVSAIDVFVDPEQNILATSELQISFSIVPTGTARKIAVTIGFSNPF